MTTRSARVAYLAVLFALFTGCGDATGPRDPTELTFAPVLNVDLDLMTRTSSGLYYLDEVVGTGATVEVGHNVTVHYEGWLHRGRKFDSSRDRGQPFTVNNIGHANVIAGWNEGLIGMRVGGHRLLVIPSHLAYGGNPPSSTIPRHATLVFRVEVLNTTP
jgi:FKBP-type peptidyl-prolyl cis-trans isomerase